MNSKKDERDTIEKRKEKKEGAMCNAK